MSASSPPENPLRQAIRWARAYDSEAERTWTYREVGSLIMSALERLVTSDDTERDVRDMQAHLEYCLRMARAANERDSALQGAVASLEHLLRCLFRGDALTDEAVQDAVESVVLDMQYCISHHE